MAPMHDETVSTPTDPVSRLVASAPVMVDEKLTLRSLAAVLADGDIGAALVRKADGSFGIVSERDLAGRSPVTPIPTSSGRRTS